MPLHVFLRSLWDRLMAEKTRSRRADFAVYCIVRSLLCLIQMLPLWCALGIARALAWRAYRVDKRHRLVAAENLRHAFPDRPESEIDQMVRATYLHACTMAVETIVLLRRLRPDNV